MNGLGTSFPRSILFAMALGVASFAFSSAAQTDTNQRAARLTVCQGTVSLSAPGDTDSVPAQLNLPLLSGVQLTTGADGEAEIEFEDGSIARVTPNSVLSLDHLAIQPGGVFVTSLSLLRGLAYFELRAAPQYLYSVNAGGDVLTPLENATVRINYDQPPAVFAVMDGMAHVDRQINFADAANAGFQIDVRAGESLRGDADRASQYSLNAGIAEDSWDQWNEDLDQAASVQSISSTEERNDYAGPQGYGWSDLDANGAWYDVPGQGPVWQPEMAADDPGFDPYGYGDWVAYPGVGYVWASSYPWGWTPYRCGNWSYFGGFGWGWMPSAACSSSGWGFYGGGRPVNIGIGPTGYRPVRVPVAGPHPIRPVMPVRTYQPPASSRPVQYGQRQILGRKVAAITPNGGGSTPGARILGSSLRRDFPIDSATHSPVRGLASTTPAAVQTTRGLRPDPATPVQSTSPPPATFGQRSNPVPVQRSAPDPQQPATAPRYYAPLPAATPQHSTPLPAAAPQHSTPPAATAPRPYSPPPPVIRPGYAPQAPAYRPVPPSQPSHVSPPPAATAPGHK